MPLIFTILIILIIGALVFVAVRYALDALGVPKPFHGLILALIILLVALWIAQAAGLLTL